MENNNSDNQSNRQQNNPSVLIYNALVIVLDLAFLLVKFWFYTFRSFYRAFKGVNERDVSNDVVLITGSGHGIGKELALQYSALGSTVVCWDINEQMNQETVKTIKSRGGKAHGYTVDVTDRERVIETGNKVLTEIGDVTILVNNAGIMPQHEIFKHSEAEIRKLYEINTLAHYWMFQAFLPKMIEKNHGHIVSMSSIAGIVGLQNLVPYCGSKFAVRGHVEALKEELRLQSNGSSKIKFTCIYPYMVDTGLCKKVKIRFENFLRLLKPSVVASAIISAQRKGLGELTVPRYMFYLNNFLRLFPSEASNLVRDFFSSGVESDISVNIWETIFNVFYLVFEIIILQLKFWYRTIESAINLFTSEPRDVSGDIVLITGAGHGMGKELALQYSELGATIVCWDINEQLNLETVKLIKSKGRKAHGYTVDVTNREKVLETGSKVQKDVGTVTILVNNAGIMPSHDLLKHTENEIRKTIDINLVAHFWMYEAFLPKMIENNHGHIVALSSMAGVMGFQNLVPYCGTKFAVKGVQEALSEELRCKSNGTSKIKFTTIFPYMVDTGLCKKVKIRFQSLMPMINPKDAAAEIIFAQRKGIEEMSLPRHLLYMNAYFRNFPNKANILVKDFLQAFVESDL
ncbi:CLUMA_CG003407, isoform A [Clunio marinus]|uniref:Short-chain dehydrogenase/reductase 3 n=1 Tax=Clunio marinus TaxID=568069 RepID=A0A1J1HQN8_9DIPT|nr:CLUMA_CG003407, isoform A [Clunio marinus]